MLKKSLLKSLLLASALTLSTEAFAGCREARARFEEFASSPEVDAVNAMTTEHQALMVARTRALYVDALRQCGVSDAAAAAARLKEFDDFLAQAGEQQRHQSEGTDLRTNCFSLTPGWMSCVTD